MSALTNAAENLILAWLLTTGTATRPTTWYVALHTGDPGEDGTANEVTTSNDADYERKAITFDAPADGQSGGAAVSWTVNAASAGFTVSHISICTAATGDTAVMKGAMPAARVLAANDVLTFNAGDIIGTVD